MTKRSALLSGLTVLLVLLGGQVVGTWSSRPVSAVNAASSGNRLARPVPERTPGTEPGTVPGGRSSGAPDLAALGVRRATGGARIALTFDDGPHPVHTPGILALLRATGVKAVFCVVGNEVRRYPGLVARIAREGHSLCNHSWRHETALGTWPPGRIRDNLLRTNAEIRKAAPGAEIRWFRHPGGMWTAAAVRVARQLGMAPLGWSVDPQDWANHPAPTIEARVLTQARPGSVILLHDGGGDRSATVRACRSLILALQRRHQLVSLP